MQFDTQSLWLYIYFPSLQLDLIQKQYTDITEHDFAHTSELRAKKNTPQAIYQSSSNQLIQINNAAKVKGIKCGMGLAKASLLYGDLQIFEYKRSLEENALEQIAQQLYIVTSDIVLAHPNGLILRAQNMLNLYGGLAGYWRVIEYCLIKTNYRFIASAAYSVHAAKLIALHSKQHFITKDRSKIQHILDKCSLAYSDIEPKDLQKLARVGMHTVKDLRRIPSAEVAGRVNRYSMNTINELLGLAPSKVKFYQPPSSFHETIELLYEIENTEKLRPILTHTLRNLAQFLCIRNARTLQIKIDFLQRDAPCLSLTFNSALPIYTHLDWIEIISLKLESVTLIAPIYGLSLHCEKHETTQASNDDLFAQRSSQIAGLSLISRLMSKLGESKVQGLSYAQDFRPEHANQLVPFTSNTKKVTGVGFNHDQPGILLTSPEVLTQQVSIIKGPERINTGWWDAQAIIRDYYIGQSQNGQRLWIYKTPNDQWYLHGFFT